MCVVKSFSKLYFGSGFSLNWSACLHLDLDLGVKKATVKVPNPSNN